MPNYYLLRSGAIVSKDGHILYEAGELREFNQAQREALLRLHNENPQMRTGEAMEILRIWKGEGLG